MIIILRPPDVAGPLRIGATGQDTVDTLRQLGDPLVLCGIAGRRPGWGVDRPSGLYISTDFDVHHRVEAIEFGRPADNTEDAVTYNGLNVFTTPAADLVTQLRRHTAVEEEDDEDGHTVTAPNLHLSFWRPPTAEIPADEDGTFFQRVRLARHGHYQEVPTYPRPP
jgi:hypothetical protein